MLTLRDLGAAAIKLLGVTGATGSPRDCFPPTPVGIALGRLDVLVVALVAIGVALVASSLPTLVQAGGAALRYAEASRQAFADAWFERQWPEVIRAGLELTVGLVLTLTARPAGSWFEARSQ